MATTRTMLTTERDLLYTWWQAKQRLEAAKDEELKLRMLVVNTSKSGQVEEGRENISVDAAGDYKLVIDHKVSYSFDYSKLPSSIDEMIKDMQAQVDTELTVDCFTVKVEFNSSKYNKSNEATKSSLAGCVTSKPGTPQVTLIEPSKKDAL